jgi:asparagine synthase (glutamine-hydrolysing)
VLGLACQERGEPLPSFTIGLDRAGPDERNKSRETAETLGSPLTTLTLDRAAIADTFPDLIRAAEGPVIDTANACLLRLAREVSGQGYKVALTGEGADEGLAGYLWYKSDNIMRSVGRLLGGWAPAALRAGVFGLVGGSKRRPRPGAIHGLRTAQQDMYDPLAQARQHLYTDDTWRALEGRTAYDDLDLPTERMSRWHPLNQSLYVEYKLMLPGHLLLGKGDRVTMNAGVEARYPYLDEDVVSFLASIAPDYKLRGLMENSGANGPAWVEELLSPQSLAATGWFDPAAVARERKLLRLLPAPMPRRFVVDACMTGVIATQLWHHTFLGGGLCSLPEWSAE